MAEFQFEVIRRWKDFADTAIWGDPTLGDRDRFVRFVVVAQAHDLDIFKFLENNLDESRITSPLGDWLLEAVDTASEVAYYAFEYAKTGKLPSGESVNVRDRWRNLRLQSGLIE
ncbi:MAG: hypothetical protein MUE98_08800 [Rhodobacteraceae bacterium]|jgi:hypothetical protein|nr:hypothetical protein [Paracoccaceae bacterium]